MKIKSACTAGFFLPLKQPRIKSPRIAMGLLYSRKADQRGVSPGTGVYLWRNYYLHQSP